MSEKNTKVYAAGPKGGLGIHWNFAYWPRGNAKVCIFARGEFVFPLRRPLSLALSLPSHVFELGKFCQNSAWLKIPCFHMFEVTENVEIRVYYVVISHKYSTRAAAQYFYPYYL